MSAATFPSPRLSPAGWWVGGALGIWFAVVFSAALAGALATPAGGLPWRLLAAMLLPVAAFGLTYRLAPAFRWFVLALDLRALVLLHSWRFVGVGFLFLSAYGVLPFVFSIPAGVGDFVAAAGAVALGAALYAPQGVSRRALLMWNAFGLADFVVAILLGMLSASGGLLQLTGAPASDAMSLLPLALIPGFIVPLFTIVHLIVFIQLAVHWRDRSRVQFRPEAV